MPAEHTLKNRIASLDGLRALAILSVCIFHFYFFFPSHESVSYGSNYADLPIAKYGYLGVMLFFAISGFVISQTLHSSSSSSHFFVKRFARLFPAMLLCSVLTFGFSFIPPVTYHSEWIYFIPSWTFIDPRIYNFIFKTEIFGWLDGSYWSLFTEVRFYLIAAIIYFMNKENFYLNFLKLAVLVGILFPVSIYFEIKPLRSALNLILIANQLPWFVFGIGCYFLFQGDKKKAITLSCISLISLSLYLLAHSKKPFMPHPVDGKAIFSGAILVYVLLISAIKVPIINRLLSVRPLTSIGIASYSLYLIHQQIGEKIITIIDRTGVVGTQYSPLLPLIVLSMLVLVSITIYHYYENPMNRLINKKIKNKL